MDFTLVQNLLAEPGKTQAGELAVMMLIPLALGFGLFGFGVSKEKEGGSPGVKYLSAIPFIIAVFMGLPYFNFARDPINKSLQAIGGRSEQMYYIAFILPVLCLVGIVVYSVIERTRRTNDADF